MRWLLSNGWLAVSTQSSSVIGSMPGVSQTVLSLRLDPELDRLVRKASAIRGESVSEFIRHAAAKRAEETLADQGRERLADVAGAMHGGGGRARQSGGAFTDALADAGAER
jgi:hypothetical protein